MSNASQPGRLLQSTWRDITFGARIWRQAPGFAATIAVLIALVVGINTSAFSILHGLLTKPAAGISGDDLVIVGALRDGEMNSPEDSYANYRDYASQSRTLQSLAAFSYHRLSLGVDGATHAAAAVLASDNYFDVLGLHLQRGRAFRGRDDGALEVVISHRFWQERLGGADDVVGRPVVVNQLPGQIVGIAPPQFHGVTFIESADMWLPAVAYARAAAIPELTDDRSNQRQILIGRLAPDVSIGGAEAELRTIALGLEDAYPAANKGHSVAVTRYAATAFGPFAQMAPILFSILAAVAVLSLVVVSLNATNLMLARIVGRQRDIAVQQSLGASRGRLARQQLGETLAIAVAGAAGAALVALWLPPAVIALVPPNGAGVKLTPDVGADATVLLYAAGLSLLAAVISAGLPALRLRRVDFAAFLRTDDRSVAGTRSRMSSGLVVVQVALAVVLLTAAGLGYRSLALADTVDLRFDKENLLLASVRTVGSATTPEGHLQLVERLAERARAIPGVEAVSFQGLGGPLLVRPAADGPPVRVDSKHVGDGYLAALRVAPLQGRTVDGAQPGAPRVAAINVDLAERLWPGQSPIGRRLWLGDLRETVEVIGMVPNGLIGTFRTEPRPGFIFLSARQNPGQPGDAALIIRHNGDLARIGPAVRAAFHAMDARVAVAQMRTMTEYLQTATAGTVLVEALLAIFAAVCLLVSIIGLYALVSFGVRRRRREFGIRLALGATPHQIVRGVTANGVTLAATGLVLGLIMSAAAGQLFRSLLLGVTPTDPTTFGAVLLIVGTLALTAAYVPARRIVRTDPVRALQQD